MARSRKANKNTKASAKSTGENMELSEDEQWRIVNDTGILKRVPRTENSEPKPTVGAEEEEEELPLAEEWFNTTLYLIPMSFMLLLMEILVHWQYGRKPTYPELWERMYTGVPILAVFIFYSNRHKQLRQTQFLLFLLSTAVGTRLIWMLNRASWRVVMKQSPPLATVWIYTVMQLDLGPAVLSLSLVGIWTWAKGFRIDLH